MKQKSRGLPESNEHPWLNARTDYRRRQVQRLFNDEVKAQCIKFAALCTQYLSIYTNFFQCAIVCRTSKMFRLRFFFFLFSLCKIQATSSCRTRRRDLAF